MSQTKNSATASTQENFSTVHGLMWRSCSRARRGPRWRGAAGRAGPGPWSRTGRRRGRGQVGPRSGPADRAATGHRRRRSRRPWGAAVGVTDAAVPATSGGADLADSARPSSVGGRPSRGRPSRVGRRRRSSRRNRCWAPPRRRRSRGRFAHNYSSLVRLVGVAGDGDQVDALGQVHQPYAHRLPLCPPDLRRLGADDHAVGGDRVDLVLRAARQLRRPARLGWTRYAPSARPCRLGPAAGTRRSGSAWRSRPQWRPGFRRCRGRRGPPPWPAARRRR